MYKLNFLFVYLLTLISICSSAQQPGDTLKVKVFHFASATRDTAVQLPDSNLSFEKIIMKYTMRCKNALVSNSNNRDQGCGEWDYSCNTYLVDSAKIEAVSATNLNYVVSNFSGNNFKYTTKPVFDYTAFTQKEVKVNSVQNETKASIGLLGSQIADFVLNGTHKSGKSQVLYTAAEMQAAGLIAGAINGITFHVVNNGGQIQFLKVKAKWVTAYKWNLNTPDLTGFSEVFFSNYTFKVGENFLPFHTALTWDGSKDLLLEISFTNTVPTTSVQLAAQLQQTQIGMHANNNYALDLMNQGFVKLDTALLGTISNEMSISFWAYGNAASMPTTTTLLYGYAVNPADRQLNIHLPHTNGNVYFDCGFSGGYDRVNKVAVPAEQGGRWNHWAFTKNAKNGAMRIYLNGSLWTSGTSKARAISLLQLLLGKDQNGGNNYKGKISQLAIYNKELADTTISRWMNKTIDATHPNYANLIAYYQMNDFGSNAILNSVTGNTVFGDHLLWSFERGENLSRNFIADFTKPAITLHQGTFQTTVSSFKVLDSLQRKPSLVYKYSIKNKEGVLPLASDEVVLDSTILGLTNAAPSMVVDATTGNTIDSIANTVEGAYSIVSMTYYKRYPFYNELLSFVTPYGIGLDLGAEGKTWYFDVSDFAPLFKGSKRFLMSLGGQNQEQIDMEFLFVVGTPPRPIIEFNQLWQGTNRAGSASIASIINDSRFPVLNFTPNKNAKSYKLRSTITGHGAEGEFENNGGTVSHMINIEGGESEFYWSVVQECGSNPIFPQGGTWVYDRQGWCPGEASLTMQQDLSPFLTPGITISIDYNTSSPQNASGDYKYHAAHQLISYGAANFQLDARINDVLQPSTKALYARKNATCTQPKIIVQNTGANTIQKLKINYWVNQSATKQSFIWTGNLNAMDTLGITLPIANLWNDGVQKSGNVFHAEIVQVNDQTDEYSLNNHAFSAFNLPTVLPGRFTLEIRSNNVPSDNVVKILDEYENVIDERSLDKANTVFNFDYQLGGCYKLLIEDRGGDGLSWWANTAQGTGYAKIKNASGTTIKTMQADFGNSIELAFTTDWILSNEKYILSNSFLLYPNPSKQNITIEGNELENAMFEIYNQLGNKVLDAFKLQANKYTIETGNLAAGVYIVRLSKNGKFTQQPLVIIP